MAITNTNMTVKPIAMLLRQINLENNISLTEENVQIRGPEVIDPAETVEINVDGTPYTLHRNTKIGIDILTDEIKDDYVDIKYQRISLTRLFSAIEPSLFAGDVLTDGALTPADVWTALLAKYEILGDDTAFVLEMAPDRSTLKLTAKPENYAYLDFVTFKLDPTLVMRVPTTLLDGFEIPQVTPLQSLNADIELTPKTVAGKVNAAAYMPLVFTGAEAEVIKNAYNTKDMAALAELLTKRSGDQWEITPAKDFTLNAAVMSFEKNATGVYFTIQLADDQNAKIFGMLRLQTTLADVA